MRVRVLGFEMERFCTERKSGCSEECSKREKNQQAGEDEGSTVND